MAGISTGLHEEMERVSRLDVPSRPTIKKATFPETTQEPPMTMSQPPAAPKTTKSGTTTMTYDTIATELVPHGEPAKTLLLVKLAPSEKRIGEDIFSNPPKESLKKAFECPQCFHILSAEIRKIPLWRLVLYFSLD